MLARELKRRSKKERIVVDKAGEIFIYENRVASSLTRKMMRSKKKKKAKTYSS